MAEENLGFKGNTEDFLQRTLQNDVPGLMAYLEPGARVLDVGCGSGNITLDVAARVQPGTAVGVDVMEERIAHAVWLAAELGIKNASFAVSDAHALRFADDGFDVAFSHTVLHSLVDPLAALAEQKRVVKPGGWVIASGVRDWGFSPRYPACPALDRVHKAWISYHERLHQRYAAGEWTPEGQKRKLAEFRYVDLQCARKCTSWFKEAGLRDLQMQFTVETFEFAGSPDKAPSMTLIPPRESPEDPLWDVHRDMIAAGFLDETDLEQAADEVAAWYGDPGAFNLVGLLFVAGRA
jgi:ubiquinone/menaquinone biosynthesis C-methylase UbiE